MIRAIIYTRVSSKEQERDGYSIDAQIKLLRDYAGINNYQVIKEYQESVSAKDVGRKIFNEMLDFLKSNPDVKYLLCEKTDRLSRNFKDIATLDQLMNEHDLTIILVKENTELSKNSRSHEKLIFGFKALIAKNYVDNLSEEVRKGLNEKAEQGNYPGGNIPYGYKIDKNSGNIKIDLSISHHIKDIFVIYASSKMSLRALASWARSIGLTTPRSGRPITMCQIERILKNPFYYGVFRWAGKIFQGNHEPIISKVLFDDTQRAFKNHNKPFLNKRKFAFGSLMICSKCGCKITAEIKKGKYVYYHCTGMRGGCDLVYLPESNIVNQFSSLLGPLVLTDKQANEILSRLTEKQNKSNKIVASEKKRISDRLNQIDRWIEQSYIDKLEGKIPESKWTSLNTKWENEANNLQLLLSAQNQNGQNIETIEKILELSQRLPVLWDKRNSYEKRELVDLLYSNCQLDGVNLYATYKKPFSIIAEGTQTQKWRGVADSLGTYLDWKRISGECYIDFINV